MGSDLTNSVSSSDGVSQGLSKLPPLHGRTTGPTRRSTKGQWTEEEDEVLREAVQRFKGKNWKKIAECFKDRTDVQCLHRWQKVLNPDLVKGPWSKEEDDVIIRLVEQYGAKKWSTIAQHLPGRIGKQCRERWHNHLNPAINKEAWTQEEELMLIKAHQVYGNKWAELTKFLPGRTDNAIKNHWNSSVKKKLDSYLASGLLDQFQGLPGVNNTSQSTPTSGDDSIHKDFEETSECSQGSTFFRRCNNFNSDMAKEMAVYTGDENQPADMAKTAVYNGDENQLADMANIVVYNGNENQHADVATTVVYDGDENQYTDMPQTVVVYNENQDADVANTVVVYNGDENQPADMANTVVVYNGDDTQPPEPCELIDSCKFIEQNDTTHEWLASDIGQLSSNDLQDPSFDPIQSCDVGSDMVAQILTPGGDCIHPDPHPYPRDGSSDSLFYQQSNCENPLNLQSFHSAYQSISINSESYQFNSVSVDPKVEENLQQEAGTLSYEPPRFPSMDIPFLSCDLVQSGGDLQDEFSPLGIRQLMMTSSSMNCFSPCRLWDSFSLDDNSPEAVLKSAAKSFSSTPSILRKRNRDLLSPLSEKRSGKKHSLFCSAKDSSQFDDNKNQQLSQTEDKENLNPAQEIDQKERAKISPLKVQQTPVLVERNSDEVATKSDTPKSPPATTPGRITSSWFVSPHAVSGKRSKGGTRFAAESIQATPLSTPLEVTDAVVENSGIFGETPFRKSLESPSAWKSPWFSFLPGPRVDTDITIEDIGYFTSPGDRSYDALGLMKQLSEHTASAYANAQEVLGNETPDSILKKKFSEKGEKSRRESTVLSERRVLDFSECGSPKQSGRHSSGISFSSPSSYLLKGCR